MSIAQEPLRFEDVSHGFVVRLPEILPAAGPVAAPYQLQVASVSGAPLHGAR